MTSLIKLNDSINALANKLFPEPYEGELGPLCDAAVARIQELERWKQQALTVLEELDLQEIGKELNVPLGESVAKQILPKLKEIDFNDTKRLDYLNNVGSQCVLNCGKVWYWRKNHGEPHNKAENLRSAIDRAMGLK